jgi:uncharacterized protein (TIGR02453 family)
MNNPSADDRRKLLAFLAGLACNNDRNWFETHRADYAAARAAFERLVADILSGFPAVDDIGSPAPQDCMFRINRDVRFSHDKSPYKTAMGALFGPEGRKTTGRSYYLHIQPGDRSFLATGLWDPTPAQLSSMRQALSEHHGEFRTLLADPEFVAICGGLSGSTLKTSPRGWQKEHPAMDLLRHTQFLASHALSDAQILSEDLADHILKAYAAMKPFSHWVGTAAGTS